MATKKNLAVAGPVTLTEDAPVQAVEMGKSETIDLLHKLTKERDALEAQIERLKSPLRAFCEETGKTSLTSDNGHKVCYVAAGLTETVDRKWAKENLPAEVLGKLFGASVRAAYVKLTK